MSVLTKSIDTEGIRQTCQKLREKIERHSDVIFWTVLALLLFSYFLVNFSNGMQKGGRWDLDQHIAMADRFLNGEGFYYSEAEASTPYFPGLGFLAVPIGWIFGGARETVMLVIASLIGTAFMFLLIRIAADFTKRRWFSMFVTAIILFSHFEYYKYYMNEFKADSLICIYAFFLIYYIDRIMKQEGNGKRSWYVALVIFSFLMDITKQQALYIDFALGVYILFTRRVTIGKKIRILGAMVGGGIAALAVMLPIPGFMLLTVKNLNQMPWFDREHIFEELGAVFDEYSLGYYAVILLVGLVLLKKVKLSSRHIMWLFISVSFFVGQLAGGMKIGGNIGNYQAGIVCFVPFVVMCAYKIVDFFIRDSKQMLVTFAFFLLLLNKTSDMLGRTRIGGFSERSDRITQASDYLSKYYAGERCMYDSNEYMMIAESKCIPGMDLNTVPYFCEDHAKDVENALKNKEYRVLVIDYKTLEDIDDTSRIYFNRESDLYSILLENYELERRDDMPGSLRNQVYVAK